MNRLKELRKKQGLSLKYVAIANGINYGTLSNYERELREPQLETWVRLANYFDVDPEYLVGWSSIKIKNAQ